MKTSDITRMVVVLCLITGVCAAALASANVMLSPMVDKQTDLNVRGPALERLFGVPANEVLTNKIMVATDDKPIPVFYLKDGDTVKTLAIETTTTSFGGDLTIMVGIDLLGNKQTGMEVVSHSDTPGLGARIEEPGFRRQWQGLPLDKTVAVTADGGTIDSISGASTTSRAAAKGTNNVLAFISKNQDKIMQMIAEK